MTTKTKIYLLTAKNFIFNVSYNIQAFASYREAIELQIAWLNWEMEKHLFGDLDGSPIGPIISCCPSFLAHILELEVDDPELEMLVLNAEIKQSRAAMEMQIKQNMEGSY